MPAPDMRIYLESLTGQTLPTVTGKPNTIIRVVGANVLVATEDNPDGAPVSLSLVQSVADRVFDGEEVVFDPHARSAFVGAILGTMDQVEVLTDPRRARLRPERAASSNPDWQFDELILALDLYLRWRPQQPPSNHPDLIALSEVLQRLRPVQAVVSTQRTGGVLGALGIEHQPQVVLGCPVVVVLGHRQPGDRGDVGCRAHTVSAA